MNILPTILMASALVLHSHDAGQRNWRTADPSGTEQRQGIAWDGLHRVAESNQDPFRNRRVNRQAFAGITIGVFERRGI